MSTAIACIITFSTTYILTHFVEGLSNYKNQKEALKCLLRSSITSQYFVYKKLGSTPSYEKENMNYMHQQYKKMGGNSYVDELMDEFNKLPLKEN